MSLIASAMVNKTRRVIIFMVML